MDKQEELRLKHQSGGNFGLSDYSPQPFPTLPTPERFSAGAAPSSQFGLGSFYPPPAPQPPAAELHGQSSAVPPGQVQQQPGNGGASGNMPYHPYAGLPQSAPSVFNPLAPNNPGGQGTVRPGFIPNVSQNAGATYQGPSGMNQGMAQRGFNGTSQQYLLPENGPTSYGGGNTVGATRGGNNGINFAPQGYSGRSAPEKGTKAWYDSLGPGQADLVNKIGRIGGAYSGEKIGDAYLKDQERKASLIAPLAQNLASLRGAQLPNEAALAGHAVSERNAALTADSDNRRTDVMERGQDMSNEISLGQNENKSMETQMQHAADVKQQEWAQSPLNPANKTKPQKQGTIELGGSKFQIPPDYYAWPPQKQEAWLKKISGLATQFSDAILPEGKRE